MREENFIPYRAVKRIAKGRAVIFAPHPDDEIFGCGGAIVRHLRQGDEIKVVIATDGGFQAGNSRSCSDYQETRRRESEKSAAILGYGKPEFLDYPDRRLKADEEFVTHLLSIITDFTPENIYLPAETEIHPDHHALYAAGIQAAIRYDPPLNLFFYEIGQPMSPALLHDITDIHPLLEQAMDCFSSQLIVQDYKYHINSLHAYRSYTLGREVKYAEAYQFVESAGLKPGDIGWQQIQAGNPQSKSPRKGESGYPLISIIVRTMNRSCLPEALSSIAGQIYPHLEVIVVDARGEERIFLGESCGSFPLKVITKNRPLNRPEAANAGLECVRGEYFCFLDEDDLFLPGSIRDLYWKLESSQAPAAYSIIERVNGLSEPEYRHDREFSFPDLLWENYIPILALLFRSELISRGCFFDEDFDVYEDWDFLLQVTQSGDFVFTKTLGGIYRNLQTSGIQRDTEKVMRYRAKIFRKWLPRLSYQQTNTLMRNITQEPCPPRPSYCSQLFYCTESGFFKESDSIRISLNPYSANLTFKFETAEKITNLRFDPINDYAQVRINSIKLFKDDELLDVALKYSSNAILVEDQVYWFDNDDPQVFIDFPGEQHVVIDQVVVEAEYLQTGADFLPLLVKLKQDRNEELQEKIEFLVQKNEENFVLIREQNEKLLSLRFSKGDKSAKMNKLQALICEHKQKVIRLKETRTFKLARIISTPLSVFRRLITANLAKR